MSRRISVGRCAVMRPDPDRFRVCAPEEYGRALLADAVGLDRAGLTRVRMRVAGMTVDAWFSDPGYAQLCARNLAYDEADDASVPEALFFLLDAESVGWSQPQPWAAANFDRRLFNRDLETAGLNGAYLHDPRVWQFFDARMRVGVQLVRRPGALPAWESGAPLRAFLHWVQRLRGGYLCHAGSVGCDGKGVLLVGAGGSGKSGTTLAGVVGGLDTVGDDYCLVRQDSSGVFAHPLFRVLKQDPPGIQRVLGSSAAVSGAPNWQGKYEILANQLPRDPFVPFLSIAAIVLPCISGGTAASSFHPIDPGQALRALGPSSSFQLPDGEREGIAFAASLCRQLPCVKMCLSENAGEIASALARFVREDV